jgi:hypothetical protein
MKNLFDHRKIAQIICVYLFALIAAVACGDSFAPRKDMMKPIGQKTEQPAPQELPANAFKPTLVSAKRASESLSGPVMIEFTFTDKDQSLTLTVEHSSQQLHASNSSNIGTVKYTVISFCETDSCDSVSALIEKHDESVEPAKVEQSAFVLVGMSLEGDQSVEDASQLTLEQSQHATTFDDAQKALQALRKKSEKK